MRKQEQGFSVVEAIMVIVIIGLLGALGWMFYQNVIKNSNNNASMKNSSAQEAAKASDQPAVTTQPVAETSYLVVKEWGVKLPVSSTISDLSYTKGSDASAIILSTNKGTCAIGNLSRITTASLSNSGTAAAQAQSQTASVYTVDKHFAADSSYLYEFATGSLGSGSQGGAGMRPACATDAIVDLVGAAVGGMSKQ